MKGPTGPFPATRAGLVSRRTAIGGMLAAAITPTILARSWAQGTPGPRSLSAGGTAPLPRYEQTITLLQDGRLLVAGGFYLRPLSSVQIYDPGAQAWSDAAPLIIPRHGHAAALLGDGSVLVAGGLSRSTLSHAEVYDPQSDAWSEVAPLNIPRHHHSAASMGDGSVFVGGGMYLRALSTSEVFVNGTWIAF